MNKNRPALAVTAAIISISISVGLGLSLAPSAFAQNDPLRNDFGQAAKGAAPLGEHSREGSFAGTAPYDGADALDPAKGRTGIGNVGADDDVCGQKLKPDELARVLGGAACPS